MSHRVRVIAPDGYVTEMETDTWPQMVRRHLARRYPVGTVVETERGRREYVGCPAVSPDPAYVFGCSCSGACWRDIA